MVAAVAGARSPSVASMDSVSSSESFEIVRHEDALDADMLAAACAADAADDPDNRSPALTASSSSGSASG